MRRQRAGEWTFGASLVLAVVMQSVNGQWFPPPISMSQYGVGPWGWVFSLWVVALAVSPVLFALGLPGRPPRVAASLLLLGLAGTVLMAVVRTQAGGAQTTLNAQVHMIGSIFCLGCLPLGMLARMWTLGPRPRVFGLITTTIVAVSLALLLVAATGVDTAGLGPTRSWAFWQTIAVFGLYAQVALFGGATRSVHRAMSELTAERQTVPTPGI